MLDRGFLKNINKLKNKLNIQNNRPSFLQDQNWEPAKPHKKQNIQLKTSKPFNLEQIKKQLGLIQLRNTKSQQPTLNNKPQLIQFIQVPSFKKQKSEKYNEIQTKLKKKQSQPQKNEQNQHDNKSGFTQRITELVKMRQQHEKIISSLVKKKTVNFSTDQESLAGSRKKNTNLQNQYIRVVQQYAVNNRQTFEEDRALQVLKKHRKIQKQQNNGLNKQVKRKSVHEMYEDIQQKLKGSQKKKQINKLSIYESPQQQFQSEKQISRDSERKLQQNNQKQIPKNLQKIKILPTKLISQQKSFKQIVEQCQQVDVISELNESTFQMQQHVNLVASLSQFQLNNSHTSRQKFISLQHQLHYSILTFVNDNLSSSKLNKYQLNTPPNIEIKYVCINSSYQNCKSIFNACKRIKGLNQDFINCVQFLTQNQVWEGLFRIQQISYQFIDQNNFNSVDSTNEYHGLCFDSGNYIEVNLSNRQLQQEQTKLLIFNFTNKQNIICDISLLLISRLINLSQNKSFPQMLNRLFGYQFKIFKIDQLNIFMDFLQYIDRLRQIHNKELRNQGGLIVEDKLNQSLKDKYSLKHIQQSTGKQNENKQLETLQYLHDTQKQCDFYLYGFNKTIQRFQLLRPAFFSQKNTSQSPIRLYQFRQLMRHEKYMKKLSQIYSKLCVINKKQLPVKCINLKHFQNHFVVVSVNVIEEGLHFISVGQKSDIIQINKATSSDLKYRICLISTSTKTILECLILSQNQSYPVYLPRQQFEVYISAYEKPQEQSKINTKKQKINNSQQKSILVFTFYIQSQHISARHDYVNGQKMQMKQLQFQLRLKEQYKNYTSMIVEQFIQFSFLDKEISKFFTQLQYSVQQQFDKEQKQQLKEHTNRKRVQEQNKLRWKNNIQIDSVQTLKSLHFSKNQFKSSQINDFQRCLQLSQINSNSTNSQMVQNFKIKKSENHLTTNYISVDQIFTFEQILQQPLNQQIFILRIHLKALDLYIDCINTNGYNTDDVQQRKKCELKVQYSQKNVLCDMDHQKNSVLLRSNTINLIYLTKNSNIQSITYQNKLCQKIHQQNYIQNDQMNKIIPKIYRKQW